MIDLEKLKVSAEAAADEAHTTVDLWNLYQQLKPSAVLELIDEIRRLKRDAERYRWIRSKHNDTDSDIAVESDSEGLLEEMFNVSPDGMDLDAAVDEALRIGF